ncbi:NAD(P)-binding oxidoreductase [Streptomyces sp900105245]|uniref:NAD(P)-dependent oxidoreductase n=1 Tax=Streptomyces sp. 900105245 TaxID=3154379 RepID=UPI00331DE67A
MNLTVFGATGGIGREIVRQALDAGHRVTAGVRDPARLGVTGDSLEVFRADLSDPDRLRAAVAGRDAVLSGLGPRTRKDAGVTTRLTRNVLHAMEAELARSDTDWTSVRPPRLQDKPLTGHYRTVVGGSPRAGRFIARADVAHAMLSMIDDAGTVGQGVGAAH